MKKIMSEESHLDETIRILKDNNELTRKSRELMLRLSKLYLEPDYNKFRAECSSVLVEAIMLGHDYDIITGERKKE